MNHWTLNSISLVRIKFPIFRDTSRVWYIPPTRGRESLGLPSPRDFPRAKPEGNPKGKANLGSPNLLLEVYHSFSYILIHKEHFSISYLSLAIRESMTIPSLSLRGSMTIPSLSLRGSMTFLSLYGRERMTILYLLVRESMNMVSIVICTGSGMEIPILFEFYIL